jgi:hypothetical protein
MQLGQRYWLKTKVVNGPGGANTYSAIVWQDGTAEPANWMVTRTTDAGNQSSGSLALVAHFVDVTFGNVTVTGPGGGSATYTLNVNVSPSGAGTVTKSPNKTTYSSGEKVQLQAVPNPGMLFIGWSGAISGSANPAEIIMDSAKSVTANFIAAEALDNAIYLPGLFR